MLYHKPAATISRKLTISFVVIALFSSIALSAQTDEAPFSLKKCWEYPTSDLIGRGLVSDVSKVYLSEVGARLEAVSINDGKKLCFSDLGGEIVSNIAERETAVFVVSRSNEAAASKRSKTVLRSLSKETGITNWVTELEDAAIVYLGISNQTLIAVSDSGNIAAVDAGSGAVRW